MDDPLLHYYERELTFMRESGAEFAKKYPKIASRLLLEPDRCEDPHTERLLEAFSFLTGRIQKKIDDSYPELTESLLQIIYPHYTRPLPSMTVVKFMPRLQNVPTSGHRVKKGTQLFSQLIKGTRLTFRTTQEIQLLPVEVAKAETTFPPNPGVGALNGIKIELNTAPKMKISQIEWPDALRFYLNGQQQQVFKLYELLMNHTVQVGMLQSHSQLIEMLHRFTPGQAAVLIYDITQILPFDVLHHQIMYITVCAIIQHTDDMRVGQDGGELGFTIETLYIGEVFAKLGVQDFNSDKTPFVDVFSQVDPGHPAATNFAKNSKAIAENLSDHLVLRGAIWRCQAALSGRQNTRTPGKRLYLTS